MKSLKRRISIIFVFLVVSIPVLLFLLPLPPLLTGISYSHAVYDDNHHLLRLTLSNDDQYRLLTPLSGFAKPLIEATLLQEDRYFYWHPGINPLSLFRAGWQTYATDARRVGASTITMQVARLRYGIHSKTLSGKIWQIVRALQLEAHYSKNQILEAYLNLAPFGNNIQGAGAASLIYFGKQANNINLPEALALVVMPQNPTKRLPDRSTLKIARDHLYERWLGIHPDDKNKQALFALPIQMQSIRDMPFLAPHFVNEVLATSTDGYQINTTLQLKLQKLIERVTQQYIARKKTLGVNNAAVMLVDTRTMETKALLGSAQFSNTSIQGQIDGTLTERSPGSTLKPFIYALAIDQGLIHPATVLKDVPRSFGSYNPENFDNDFVGPIKASDALVLSRNIPAIFLADQLHQPSLYEFLQRAGITHLKSARHYGLALVLGGAELSMQELVGLYAALANDGILRAIRFTSHQPDETEKRLLSAEASYLVLEMLKDTEPPSTSPPLHLPVSWKTGTSSGYRDAWTIGIVGPYVLAVWIGNFNNEGNKVFIGKEIAAPLFFEIAAALHTQSGPLKERHSGTHRLHLTKVDVCKASGMLPNHACRETEAVWFIPGKSPIKVDTVHREIPINRKTGLRTCLFDKDTRFEVYEYWSSDLLDIFKRAGMQRKLPPAFDPNCARTANINQGFAPQIISPQTHVNYITTLAATKKMVIPFKAVFDADVKHLYWFLNESFLGLSLRDKPFLWQAKPGRYIVRVVDDAGRSDAQEVVVLSE